jgi:hypothetical protein
MSAFFGRIRERIGAKREFFQAWGEFFGTRGSIIGPIGGSGGPPGGPIGLLEDPIDPLPERIGPKARAVGFRRGGCRPARRLSEGYLTLPKIEDQLCAAEEIQAQEAVFNGILPVYSMANRLGRSSIAFR